MEKTKIPYTVSTRCPQPNAKSMEAYWDKWNPPSANITAEFIKEREQRDKDSDRMIRQLTKAAFIRNSIGFKCIEKLPKRKVTEVKYLYGYKLKITFDTHETRVLDFEKFLFSPKYDYYEPLQDIEEFKKVIVDCNEIYWDELVIEIKADDLYNWQNVLY